MIFPTLTSKFILAPMAGINDIAFRLLCKEYGCGLVVSEMVSSPALCRDNASTWKLVDFLDKERPFSVQLFGQKTEWITNAALLVEKKFSPNVIDLNLGCPATKIIKQGSGSALLLRKNRIKEIVESCVNKLNTPFSVKIRSGADDKHVNAIEVAKICEEAGACAITVHPRTSSQGYSGTADWKIIKQVKEAVNVPVIGNGNVFVPEDAKKMFEQTGCDFIMIGRAAMKNPYVFRQMNDYFEKGKYKEVDDEIRKQAIKKYLLLAEEHKINFISIKIHLQHFTAGMKKGSKLRNSLSHTKDLNEVRVLLNKFI